MEDLISIIIPVYNHTEHLQEVLDGLARQTYQSFEVIMVDDGSTVPVQSGSFKMQNGFSIVWLRQENKGAPAARNFGFSQSHGEYVMFYDADVIASPDMLEKFVAGLENNPEASYAYCDHYFGAKRIVSRDFDEAALKKNNYITTMSMIRRQDFPRFDEGLKRFQDWDLWLTMSEQGKRGIYISGFLFRTYPHAGGISTWLPSYAYKFPFKYLPMFYSKVKAYEISKRVVEQKHHLI